MGHRLTKVGLKADPKKIQAITEMKVPETKKSLTRMAWDGELSRQICYPIFGKQNTKSQIRFLQNTYMMRDHIIYKDDRIDIVKTNTHCIS